MFCEEMLESCLFRDLLPLRKLNNLRFEEASDKFPPSDSSPAFNDFFDFFSFLPTEDTYPPSVS